MIDTSLLIGQLAGGAVQQAPQSLPSVQQKDVSRFQDLMKSNGPDDSTAIRPQSVDSSSVLQLIGPDQKVEEGGLADRMINMATKMDGDYHSLLAQMKDRPGFDSYLSGTKDVVSDEILTYPHVRVDTPDSNTYETTLKSIQDSQNATLAYQSDMNNWALNFRIWSTGVEIVSAAAKKVSQGFQTLFRASG